MAIVQHWKIRSRAHHCSKTGVAFEEGQFFYTCISEDPETEDAFVRHDYCEEAWKVVQPTLGADTFSYWRSKYEGPDHSHSEEAAAQQADAETLLNRMVEEDDPRMDKARYILVLSLERRKVLRQVGERRTEDRRLLIYEHRKTGEVIMVTDPEVRLDEVDALQDEVARLLEEMSQPQPVEGESESAGETSEESPVNSEDPGEETKES